jgi:hypothetical protein
MASNRAGFRWTHWSVVVPLASLVALTVAYFVQRAKPLEVLQLDLTPPSSSELRALVHPARTRALFGKLSNPDDTPVAEALVWLEVDGEPHWTYTDAAGAFRIDELPRGPWNVSFVAREHLPVAWSLPDSGAEQLLRLPDAPRALPRAGVVARSALVGQLVGAHDPTGFEVVCVPSAAPQTLDAPVPRRTLADAAGRFGFDDLILGEYTVEVRPAWAAGGSWPDLARPLASAAPLRWVHPGPDAKGVLELALQTGSVHGRIEDDKGRALEGALLLLWPAGRPERVWPPVATDAAGAFRIDALPAGSYVLTVRAAAASAELALDVSAGSELEVRFPALQCVPAQDALVPSRPK